MCQLEAKATANGSVKCRYLFTQRAVGLLQLTAWLPGTPLPEHVGSRLNAVGFGLLCWRSNLPLGGWGGR